MISTWYAIVSFMLIVYVALDGRNFGAGMLHWVVARTPEERWQVIAAIGPLWSWHEVWLVGFGGTLVAVFPRLLASAFAGYYLALFLILWCLILRGVSIEVGGHINDRQWQGFWDFVFVVSNFLLAILFGAAAGNVVRGVPLDADGTFSMAFFTDFKPRGNVGLLDWYTVSMAVFTTVILAAHGATYLTLKTEGPVHDRSAKWAKFLWAGAVPLFVAASIESWQVHPDLFRHAMHNPLCWLGWLILVGAIFGIASGMSTQREMRAFVGSNVLLVGLLVTGAAALFPVILSSTLAPENSLTAYGVAAGRSSLLYASIWWPVGLALAISYFVFITRRYVGKVSIRRGTQGEGPTTIPPMISPVTRTCPNFVATHPKKRVTRMITAVWVKRVMIAIGRIATPPTNLLRPQLRTGAQWYACAFAVSIFCRTISRAEVSQHVRRFLLAIDLL